MSASVLNQPRPNHPEAMPSATETRRVGLIAGSGRYPILFAEAARRQGIRVECVGIREEADPVLASICQSYQEVRVSRLGALIAAFRRVGANELVMAGKIQKSVMFTPGRLLKLRPDLRMLQFWYRRVRDKRDDSLLLGIIGELERDGMTVTSALDYCPELLVEPGVLTSKAPTDRLWADIAFGWDLAKQMGRLDVGQSVAVKEQAAIAVEAIEGTDRCIERAGQLCRSGGWTLVKVAKPQQDMRFDVPTVGPSTIASLANAGAKVLAVEAHKTILIDRDEVLATAKRHGLILCALVDGRRPSDDD